MNPHDSEYCDPTAPGAMIDVYTLTDGPVDRAAWASTLTDIRNLPEVTQCHRS